MPTDENGPPVDVPPVTSDPQETDERPPEPVAALSVAGAARGVGVAPGTLRSWERRYGLGPSLHTPGGHRRYGPVDLGRLAHMRRLVQEGVPPAEAARVVIGTDPGHISGSGAPDGSSPHASAPGVPDGAGPDGAVPDGAGPDGAGPGGGRVLSTPRGPRAVRGLARAAMALDAHACRVAVADSLAQHGTIATWEDLVRPVLGAIGDRWARTSRGVEIEHSFSMVVTAAMAAHGAGLARPRNGRPVVLASAANELHDLPLVVLGAALADVGIRTHLIGARTPDIALRDAVGRIGPPVVFLWAQMPGTLVPQLEVQRPAATLILGGPGWAETGDEAERVTDLGQAVGAVRAAMGL